MTMPLDLAPAGYSAPAAVPAVVPSVRVNPLVRGALVLFSISIFFEIPHRSFPIEVPTFFALLFLLTTLLNPRACYKRIPTPLIWFAAHLWILAIAAVYNGVEHMDVVIKHFIDLTVLMLLLWTISNVLRDARALRATIVAFIVGAMVRAGMQVLHIAVHRIPVWTGGERMSVLGQNTNMSAIVLSAGLITVVGLYTSHASWLPKFHFLTWPLAALMGWATIQTGSRGGLFCIAIGLVVFLFSGRTPMIRLRNVLLGLVAMGALGAAAMYSPMMRARLEAAGEQGNLAGREKIYPAVLGMIAEKPLLGWGPIDNQFEIGRRINERKRPSRDAHNLPGELLTTSGIIGAVPFLIGIGIVIRSAYRARKGALGYLPLALLSAVLMGCLSGTWLISKILWFSLAIAVVAGARWADPMTIRIWSVEPCAD
jgi:O-antigen ligase